MSLDRYYKILGLDNDASLQDVRKRYRTLAMKYHPDRNVQTDSEEKFIAITEAYEILIGKKEAPFVKKTIISPEKDKEIRVKAAQQRFKEQLIREHLENEFYFRKLTSGNQWRVFRFTAIFSAILSLFLTLDYLLPHHYEKDRVATYSLNGAVSPGGKRLSLIKTEKGNYYWISGISHKLYGPYSSIFVESSWIFHNSIQIISPEKLGYTLYEIHFSMYSVGLLLIVLFLTPLFTVYYKRKNVYFTVLYHFSFYIVNAVMLYFVFSEDRWAHMLTLGFI